jgi:hypothetical protein
LISGFLREVDEIFAVLGNYVVYVGKFLSDVAGQPIVPIFKAQDGAERLF